jgi:hypothetical protein
MKERFEAFSLTLGYLLTFRTHGSWLHGDAGGSVDRFHNVYGTSLPPDSQRQAYERNLLKARPLESVGKSAVRHEMFIAQRLSSIHKKENIESCHVL